MSGLRQFIRDARGAGAAEFALVLPLMLLFLFAIIDVGRFVWAYNEAEKATQVGARWAVATDMVPSDLIDYSFAVDGGIPQGTAVPSSAFPGVRCASSGGSVNCNCVTDDNICPGSAGGSCDFDPNTTNATAFNAIVGRMQLQKPDITAENVVIDYCNSGLGFSGDPHGPDVAPIITVRLQNMTFSNPMTTMVFGSPSINIPSARYSLTMEDGKGDDAHY